MARLGPGCGSQYLTAADQAGRAERTRSTSRSRSRSSPQKQQKLLLYGPGREEAPRTGFHGILELPARHRSKSPKSDGYREWHDELHVGDDLPRLPRQAAAA